MNLSLLLRNAVLSLHEGLALSPRSRGKKQGVLLCFLIHSLFESEAEAHCGLLDPQQAFTVGMLREFLAYFSGEGYCFLSPPDLARELSPQGRYVLLTFDDGYYNNKRAIPLLEEFDVPAVFFISSDHVKQGKAFWWDAVYRGSKKRGRPREERARAIATYKQMRGPQIEADICSRFGKSALWPVGDLDRPFTVDELRAFARHRLVFLGNHTRDHAILTNYSAAGAREQIAGCQQSLREMTGITPEIIAYPNGNCSEAVCEAAREAGLHFGLLARAGRNRLPLKGRTSEAMALKRFTLWGSLSIQAQCRASRSDLSIQRILQFIRRDSAHALPLRHSA